MAADGLLVTREAAAAPPDYDGVWWLVRSLIWAGENTSPNHAVMANDTLRQQGRVFEFDCEIMASWLVPNLAAAIFDRLHEERDVRKCAARLTPSLRRVVKADKELTCSILRSMLNIGDAGGRANFDATFFAGLVLLGVANAQASKVDVDTYRDRTIEWCVAKWPEIAAMEIRLPA